MLIIDLSPEARSELAIAISHHLRRRRVDRVPVPLELRQLGAALGCPASSGQQRSPSRPPALACESADGTPAALLLRPADAAAMLGVSVRTLRRLVAAGLIESVQHGRSRRFLTRDLIDYAEAKADRDIRRPVRAD